MRATREPTEARASATETATSVPAAPTPADTQVPAAPPAAGVTGAGEEAGLGDEVAELRKRLAALESVVVATPAAGDATPRLPGAAHPPASHEGARPFLVPTAELPNAQDLGPSLAMAGVGVVIGFLLGAAYGRRQERNRRSRVRF